MRKAKSLIGLNIVSQLEGKQLGTVRDLIFDDDTHNLIAVLLSDRELFGMIDATVVPWSQVRQIGPHAIMVPDETAVEKAHTDPSIAASFDQKKKLVGKKITTQQGEDLGTVADLYLHEDGRVQGFEVSGGIFADAFSGKRFMELPSELTVGQDRVLVPQGIAVELMRQKVQQPGGIAAVAANVSDSASELASKAGDAYDVAKTKVSDGYANIATASVEKQREFVIGKVASRDVVIPASKATMATPQAIDTLIVEEGGATELTSAAIPDVHTSTPATATDVTSTGEVISGEVLVRSGETITSQHADRAIASGVLAQLVTAAAGSSIKNVYNSATRNVSGASDQYVPASEVETTAVPVTTYSTPASSSPGVVDKMEVASIGKPSAREILAPDGTVIIAPGMLVTREILDLADTYGKKGEVITAAGLGVASEKAQVVYSSAKEQAGSLWDTIKGKTAELTGSAQEKKAEHDNKVEQSKINNALGRPVTRVILAQDDSIILNTGDLITNAAVAKAREAGVLSILLDSVYETDLKISPEMLRAEGKGREALDEQVVPTGSPIISPEAEQKETQQKESEPVVTH